MPTSIDRLVDRLCMRGSWVGPNGGGHMGATHVIPLAPLWMVGWQYIEANVNVLIPADKL